MKRRAVGSAQTSASAWRKGTFGAPSTAARARRAPSTPHTARQVTRKAAPATLAVTATRRVIENGSRKCPAVPAVTMKPAIIMIQTIAAAEAWRAGATRSARSASNEVPDAPTPTPMTPKARVDSAMPARRFVAASAVARAASTAPAASAAMPPTIQGVRRPPTSEPWPQRGRRSCTA